MTHLTTRHWLGIASALTSFVLAACGDASRSLAPRDDQPSRSVDGSSVLADVAAAGATKSFVELSGSIDDFLTFSCLDEPIRFVVTYTWTFDFTTTSSGISSVRSNFIVDRSVTYTVYKGVTYYVAQGRVGHDDNIHYLYGPDGLYIEAGTEPDFESSATGERLRLNFHWQIVVAPDGTTKVNKLTGSCPP